MKYMWTDVNNKTGRHVLVLYSRSNVDTVVGVFCAICCSVEMFMCMGVRVRDKVQEYAWANYGRKAAE